MGPGQCGGNGSVPTCQQYLSLGWTQPRLEPRELPAREKLFGALPQAEGDSGQPGGTQRRGFDQIGPLDRNPEHIGLKLHEPVVGRSTTIDPERRTRQPLGRGHGVEQLGAAIRHGLERRTYQVRASCAPGQPGDGPSGLGFPIRGSQPNERGHEVHPGVVGNAAGVSLALGRRSQESKTVPQPLHGGACDEYASLEGVGRLAQGATRRGCEHARWRCRDPIPGQHEQEGPGPIRVLGQSRRNAALAEERGLLIAGEPGNRERVSEMGGIRLSDRTRRAHYVRQYLTRHPEDAQQLGLPVAGAEIVEQGA